LLAYTSTHKILPHRRQSGQLKRRGGDVSRHRLRHHCQKIASFVVRQQGEQGRWKEAKALVLALPEADPWDETFAELMAQVDARPR
jgi:hypothetical protein